MQPVVDPQPPKSPEEKHPSSALSAYVMGYVNPWRQVRDSEYKAEWDRSFQTYMGIWNPASKNKTRERSKLIPPGYAMAVDLTVAEIVESLFSRDAFFDVDEGADEAQRDAAALCRESLMMDLHKDGIIKELSDAALCGALYGAGILKVATDVKVEATPKRVPALDDNGKALVDAKGQPVTKLVRVTTEKAQVKLVSAEPGTVVTDPGTPNIEEMLGIAFEYQMPLHLIRQRQKDGIYFQCDVGPYQGDAFFSVQDRRNPAMDTSRVETAAITEWHGFVPRNALALSIAGYMDKSEARDNALQAIDPQDEELVDAVVMIANGNMVLKAMANPSIMQDRAAVAWQHNTLPGRFIGRSVWNAAKHVHLAQEAEMRARVDVLAWTSNPMFKADLSKLPPKSNFDAWPGKVWATRGDPDLAIREFKFSDVHSSTFQHMNDLQSMLQQAVGTVDAVAQARSNIRDETATGNAIAVSGFLKRAKRVLFNIEVALTEGIRKVLWRKMQYEPERYPTMYDFVVKGTMGMVAREIEAQQRLGLVQYIRNEQLQTLIVKSVVDSGSDPKRVDISKAIEGMLKPDPQAQQMQEMQQKLGLENMMLTNRKMQAEISKIAADAGVAGAKEHLTKIQAETEKQQTMIENLRLILDKQEVENQSRQMDISEAKLDLDWAKLRQQAKEPKGS